MPAQMGAAGTAASLSHCRTVDTEMWHGPGGVHTVPGLPTTGQKETNADVYRVWRSEIPQNIKESIQLRELVNIRQKSHHARWWEM